MVHNIAEIKGMDATIQSKLETAHITTVEHLLEQAGTPAQRTALAKQLEVSSSQLTEWLNRADLMRLKGVGTEMANLLEECGVDSCKELQHRVAANLQTKLKTANDEKHSTHHAPTLAQVEAWITEAATFAASSCVFNQGMSDEGLAIGGSGVLLPIANPSAKSCANHAATLGKRRRISSASMKRRFIGVRTVPGLIANVAPPCFVVSSAMTSVRRIRAALLTQ